MKSDWYHFQELIKEHFMSLGCFAETNVSIQGVRTHHNIDIVVKSNFLGQDLFWIVEAKKWNSNISKLHVMALRQIIEDIGADKGFLISEKGFQKGAIEAALKTNIKLATYDEMVKSTKESIQRKILNQYIDRFNLILNKYYSHSKEIRIKYNLRPEPWVFGYSIYTVLNLISFTLKEGYNNAYPIKPGVFMTDYFKKKEIENFNQLINWLNTELLNVEVKIFKAEIEMQKNNDFNPCLYYLDSTENPHIFPFKIKES